MIASRSIRNPRLLGICLLLACCGVVTAQTNHKYKQEDKFRQLEEVLPTANAYRTASGAPAKEYWQQQVDYDIDVRIDDDTQKLFGSERITYQNNSPDSLSYLGCSWIRSCSCRKAMLIRFARRRN